MKQIFIGKTIDEAKELAIKEFGIDDSRITFEVLEEPKKTLFGRSKGEAKVSAFYEKTKLEIALDYIKKVVNKMGIENAEFNITENEAGAVVEVSGNKCEMLIGRKGETLDALQYLTSLVCNKGDKDYYRISLDTCGYREKRKNHLEDLARKMSKNVIKNGRTCALEPMNPYERRIVHSVISEIEGVSSHSAGNEPYRKVIISSNNRRNDKRGNYNNKYKKNSERKSTGFDIKTSFEKDYKKPRPEDNLNSGLYSKIEF